jgi:hypothetical protein
MTIPTSGPGAAVQPADPSPVAPSPAAAANAELSGLVNNKEWAAKYFAGDSAARAKFTELTTAVANSDTLPDAIAGTAVAPPLIETVVDGDLPFFARSSAIQQMRETGLSDQAILEAITGKPNTRAIVEEAKAYQRARHGDPEWVARLLKGDFQAKKEQLLLSIILTNPVEGSPTSARFGRASMALRCWPP